MKQFLFFTAIIFTSLSVSAQLKNHKKEKITGTYSTYSAIIDSTGKEIKNPQRIEAMKAMIQYINNNWLESSNIYRSEHIHTSINYTNKKTLNNI